MKYIFKFSNSPLNFSGNQGPAVQPPEAGHVSLQGRRARSTNILDGLRRAHGKLTLRYIIHLILVYLLHLKYVPDVKCMKPKMSKCPVPFTNTYLKRLYRIYKTALLDSAK